jgi:hypothetical protein
MTGEGLDPRRVALELLPCSDPIAGTITGPDGHITPFVGWMELVGAIDRVHATTADMVENP